MAAEAFVLGMVETADEDEDDSAGMAADLWEEREVLTNPHPTTPITHAIPHLLNTLTRWLALTTISLAPKGYDENDHRGSHPSCHRKNVGAGGCLTPLSRQTDTVGERVWQGPHLRRGGADSVAQPYAQEDLPGRSSGPRRA